MKENIDELFRKGLSEPDIPFEEMHWLAMQQKLDQKKNKRRTIAWWTLISSAAALLLITFAWWNLQTKDNENLKSAKIKKHTIETDRDTSASSTTNESKSVFSDKIEKAQPQSLANQHKKEAKTKLSTVKTYTKTSDSTFNINQKNNNKSTIPSTENLATLTEAENSETEVKPEGSVKESFQIESSNGSTLATSSAKPVKTKNKPSTTKPKFKPGFTLSITAAQDLNAVNTFKRNSVGANAGILATVSVSPRLSFTTGAVYAKKIYSTGFSSYKSDNTYQFPINPTEVDANCHVLDIPLNANFKVWESKNKKAKINISGGASSYIMLKEKYEFKYDNPYYQPVTRTYKNENRHYFGVANLSVSYDRKLNNQFGIGIQPYLKLPISDIGHGNVKLLSAGVAVNINLNLKKSHD